MQESYTIFKIPSFERSKTYDFEADLPIRNTVETKNTPIMPEVNVKKSVKPGDFAFYDELNQIAEELEKWRLANS